MCQKATSLSLCISIQLYNNYQINNLFISESLLKHLINPQMHFYWMHYPHSFSARPYKRNHNFFDESQMEVKLFPCLASFKHETMGPVFCYEYCNYHSSCQIFHPPLIISLFLQRSNSYIYLHISLLMIHTVWINVHFKRGGRVGTGVLCAHWDGSDDVL